MYFRQEIGRWGENLACQYLEENNYKIIERNFSCRQGEIDVIAEDTQKKEIVFIEVKTRSNLRYGNPAEAVNGKKQNHINQVAKYYIYKRQISNIAVRFDVIEIYIQKPNFKVNHIPNVSICSGFKWGNYER